MDLGVKGVVLDISDDPGGGNANWDESTMRDDESLARRLQEEERLRFAHQQQERERLKNTTYVNTLDDEIYAQRLEQELRDEQTAQNLYTLELAQREAPPPGGYVDVVAPQRNPRRNSTFQKVCRLIISITLAFVVVVVILFFTTPWFRNTGIADIIIPDILFGDGNGGDWQGTSDSTSFSRWDVGGGDGLDLIIQNALTSDWDTYLNIAVDDWNMAPALKLEQTRRFEGPDPPCEPEDGIMKVCNNNYGLTGWIGLNEVYFNRRGFIIHSVAKMNESYLRNAPAAEKQYVVCHEMGHGFGLPHRDENPMNADLGTCLDYSRKPQNNQHPDETDYENLARLYGTFPDKTRRKRKQRRKLLRRGLQERIPESLQQQQLEHKNQQEKQIHPIHGRLLLSTGRGAIYERPSDDSGKIITNVLWA